ncbi:MAG: XRE family transcriptional regulator [Planctomycetota bacterium]
MKILSVEANNHRKAFEVRTRRSTFVMPYARVAPRPTGSDRIAEVYVDDELGREAFTYELESGAEGSVHIDSVLDYNADPNHLADLLLYRLTLEAQKRIERSPLSRREVARRLGTSVPQLYRLLDQTNYGKSLHQLVSLLAVLGCEVQLKVRKRSGRRPPGRLAG